MRSSWLEPDVISYNSAISACEKGQQWKQALSQLLEMWTPQRTPDVINYNSAISACEKGQQSEQALSLLLEMWTSHLALVAYVPCRAVPCRAVPCRAVPCRAVRVLRCVLVVLGPVWSD